jgi:hypothetical protein
MLMTTTTTTDPAGTAEMAKVPMKTDDGQTKAIFDPGTIMDMDMNMDDNRYNMRITVTTITNGLSGESYVRPHVRQ